MFVYVNCVNDINDINKNFFFKCLIVCVFFLVKVN